MFCQMGNHYFLIFSEATVCKCILTNFFYHFDHFDVVDRVLVLIVGIGTEL